MARTSWTREELLIAFNFYCRTPFGRLHSRNPDIIELAQKIGRTPGAVAMKCCNFASFDPLHQSRGIMGLGNAAHADRNIWEEFNGDSERLAYESQQAFQQIMQRDALVDPVVREEELVLSSGQTEKERVVRARLIQSFFRVTVLTSYDYQCAICGLNLPPLLVASHIIPWSHDKKRRGDPTNGLSLCAIHDRAFDRGILSVDGLLRIIISDRAKVSTSSHLQVIALNEFEGKPLTLPKRFRPDPLALTYHREHILV